jgi:predicted transcriptional regulator
MSRIVTKVLAVEEQAREMGISIDELCRRAKIDRATWTRWKSGASVPRFDAWLRVEDVIGLTAA